MFYSQEKKIQSYRKNEGREMVVNLLVGRDQVSLLKRADMCMTDTTSHCVLAT